MRPAIHAVAGSVELPGDVRVIQRLNDLSECPHYGTIVHDSNDARQLVRDKFSTRRCYTCSVDRDTAIDERIGAAIKAWLEHAGVSVGSLHKRTGIARNTLYEILKSSRFPSVDVLKRIAPELGTTAGALLDGTFPTTKGAKPQPSDPLVTLRADVIDVQRKLADFEERVAPALELMPAIEDLLRRSGTLSQPL